MSPAPGAQPGASPSSGEPHFSPSKASLAVLAIGVALLSIPGSIHRAGIWDPVELETAELARRIAQTLLGAEGLADVSAESVPTRGELGRGELPFTAIAVGFRLFGLSAWAGRLPLAFFGLLGLFAIHFLVRRLAGARAGWIAVLVLATMPLYFLHARTMFGDIVTMAAHAGSMAGLGIATFDRSRTAPRVLALLFSVLALAAGFGTRGVLIGVALPLLGVGIAWLVLVLGGARQGRFGDVVGLLALLLGSVAIAAGVYVLHTAESERYSMLLAAFGQQSRLPLTFESLARDLGHALFPWSAVIPFAAGRMMAAPVVAPGVSIQGVQALRILLLTSAAVAFIGQALLAPDLGVMAYAAPAAVAAVTALALHDLDFGAPASRVFGLCVGALGLVLLFDLENLPAKALVAYSQGNASVPAIFDGPNSSVLLVMTVGALSVFFFLVQEKKAEGQTAFEPRAYAAWPRTLQSLWAGNLLFCILLALSALLVLELFFSFAGYLSTFRGFAGMGQLARVLVRSAFLALLGVCALPLLVLAGRDTIRVLTTPSVYLGRPGQRTFLASFGAGRGASAAVVIAAVGGFMSLGYFPKLMNQLSPMPALEAYQRLARKGEPLGVLGARAEALRFHASGQVREFSSATAALGWFTSAEERRFLLFRSEDLAVINGGFRARRSPPQNLPIPIRDSASSEVLLAVNLLEPDEKNHNPLEASVLNARPNPSRKLNVDLGGKLDVLGWEIDDSHGKRVESVVPGVEYEFVIYFHVKAQILGSWDTFIHVDGLKRRFNGDHPTLGGAYPLALWRPGDHLADRHRFRLDPHFAPGTYQVYFGLYNGSRRLEVRRGPHDENRILAGTLEIR